MALVCALVDAWNAPPQEQPPRPAAASDEAETSSEDARSPDDKAEESDVDARLRRLESESERLRERVEELEAENDELREEQDLAFEEREALHERIDRPRKARFAFGGYLDAGLFWAQGNGSGIVQDDGRLTDHGRPLSELYPDVRDSWRFYGDPLATAVNARGEPADTGSSQALLFDSIDGSGPNRTDLGGRSTIVVNALNLSLRASLGEQVLLFAMLDFVPRGRDMSRTDTHFVGDFLDLKLAYVMWRPPVRSFSLEIYGGKIDSVFGREYRIQEAPNRIEVTPSLVCRYTCGRPVGISTRMGFFDRALSLSLSLTNGSTYQETFAFYNEIDRNHAKTATGRIAWQLPWAHLQLGASGEVGAQDLQPSNRTLQHQYGVDAHMVVRGFELAAEFLQGRARGRDSGVLDTQGDCDEAPCLSVVGAYGTVGYRVLNWLMPYFRADWRDATHRSGSDFVYVSRVVRLTPGLRFEITPHIIVKAQYSFILEPALAFRIPNDVFTSSVVAHF